MRGVMKGRVREVGLRRKKEKAKQGIKMIMEWNDGGGEREGEHDFLCCCWKLQAWILGMEWRWGWQMSIYNSGILKIMVLFI